MNAYGPDHRNVRRKAFLGMSAPILLHCRFFVSDSGLRSKEAPK